MLQPIQTAVVVSVLHWYRYLDGEGFFRLFSHLPKNNVQNFAATWAAINDQLGIIFFDPTTRFIHSIFTCELV